ncbi:type II secretion system F family protein, partial [Clostridium sp.]|uniref:type II secretion system F family protein n=1 Tax=Clostridium sp. TaxID=1506 RepID=UPI003F35BEF6
SKLYNQGIHFLGIMELLKELPLSKSYKESITNMESLISIGKSLEEALKSNKELYSEFFISMVSIGEKSGRLPQLMKGIEEYYLKLIMIKKKVKDALMYPLFIFISLIGLSIFFISFIIPSFYDIYLSTGVEPPKIFTLVYKLLEVFRKDRILFITYIFTWGILIPLLVLKLFWEKYLKKYLLKLKIIKLFNEYMVISLISTIVNSGINISTGLDYCSRSFDLFGNNNVKSSLLKINKKILLGNTLASAIYESNSCSKYTVSMIKLGESSGNIDERLMTLSIEIEEKIINLIDKLLKLIQPTMIIFMALLVLTFVVVFVIPLFNTLLGGVV